MWLGLPDSLTETGLSRASPHSRYPLIAAKWSGVLPSLSAEVTEAPWTTRLRTMAGWFWRTAMCSGE